MRKVENFARAVDNRRTVESLGAPYTPLQLAGIANLFEIAFELSWKAMKETLSRYGYDTAKRMGSPQGVIQIAYQVGMVDDEVGWVQMLEDRSTLSHVYDENIALDVVERARTQHLRLFEVLAGELAENWPLDLPGEVG